MGSTWVQSQVESYQRLLKWYLIPPWLTLGNIRYVSRVKWNNSGKGVAPFPTPRCSSYWKGSLLATVDYSHQLYLYIKLTKMEVLIEIFIIILTVLKQWPCVEIGQCWSRNHLFMDRWSVKRLGFHCNSDPGWQLLYTQPMNINGYVQFLIRLYTVPMNINGYVPFLINTLNTIMRG